MNAKYLLIFALSFILISLVPAVVLSDVSVGVKVGDYVEYNVTHTGNIDQLHDLSYFRMEVVSVQGKEITISISMRFSNGTTLPLTENINLDTGQMADELIIPANLNAGEAFLDKNQDLGNLTISGVEQKTFAGATRTVLTASGSLTSYFWDKSTGVRVESISTEPNYTLTSTMDKTNMWQPQLFGLEPTVFYAIIIVIIVIVVASIAIFVTHRKKISPALT